MKSRVEKRDLIVKPNKTYQRTTPKKPKEITVINAERSNLLIPVREAMKHLQEKKLEFYTKKERSLKYSKAYYACFHIKKSLEEFCTKYESNEIDLDEFKLQVKQLLAAKDNKAVYVNDLKTHRGFKEIFYNIMIGVASLGMAHFVYSVANQRLFFFHIPTQSEAFLNNVGIVADTLSPKR